MKMCETLREIMKPCTMYDSGQSCGIFVNLYTYASTQTVPIEIPFLPDLFTAQLLDTVYFDGHSGQKHPAPLVRNLIDAYPQKTQAASVLASMFWALHGANLLKQYEVVQAEYNPIENYNMIEHIHDYTDTEGTNKVTDTHTGGYTDGTTNHITENAIYGFDSATPTPSDKTTENGAVSRTYNNDKIETETEINKHTDTDRAGNIGTTTSQMMLQSQIDLWQWNFYNNYLFPVVDSVLALLIY